MILLRGKNCGIFDRDLLKVGHTLDDDELDELIEFCVLEYPNTGEVALTAYLKDYNFTTTKRCIAQDRSCRC